MARFSNSQNCDDNVVYMNIKFVGYLFIIQLQKEKPPQNKQTNKTMSPTQF